MTAIRNLIPILFAAHILAACADTGEAPISRAVAARYVPDGPSYVEVITMINNKSGFAEHTGIIISGSQTVLYDPAGTFRYEKLPRRQDVFYGLTPRFGRYYKRYHARFDYHLEIQRVPVTLEEADALIASAEKRGATRQLFCARSASDVLNDVPTFAHVKESFFPRSILNDVARISGVTTSYVYEDDVGQNLVVDAGS